MVILREIAQNAPIPTNTGSIQSLISMRKFRTLTNNYINLIPVD